MPIKSTTTIEGGIKRKEKKKKSKRIYRTNQNIRIIHVFLEYGVSSETGKFNTKSPV